HPLRVVETFPAEGPAARFLRARLDLLDQGRDLPAVGPRQDDEAIDDLEQGRDIEHQWLDGLLVFRGVDDHVDEVQSRARFQVAQGHSPRVFHWKSFPTMMVISTRPDGTRLSLSCP